MSSGENVFANPERWAEPTRDGGFILTDPVSGDRINPNVPPAWIEEDPYLHAGYEYLRMNGANINLEIAYGRHREAADLGDPQLGWFEKKVAEADYYGYEASHYRIVPTAVEHDTAGVRLARIRAQGREDFASYLDLAGKESRADSFHHRQYYAIALAGRNTECFPADVASDGRPIEGTFTRARRMILGSAATALAAAASTSMVLHREWFSPAKFGLRMLEKEAGRSPYRDINGLATIGGYHKDLERKYQSLHVNVTRRFLLRSEVWRNLEEVETFRSIAHMGIILPEEVPSVRAMHQVMREGHAQALGESKQ